MLSTSDTAAALRHPATAEHRRGIGRPFRPGESGNPSGKAKAAPDPGVLARKHTVACIRALVRALAGPDQQASVAAAQALLAEAHGLPVAHHAHHMPNLTMIVRAPTEHDTDHSNGEARAWDA